MTEVNSPHYSRRALARSALLGGASCVLGATTSRAEGEPNGKGLIDARQFGAKGDGKTDDTKAIQRAVDAVAADHGAIFMPPGVYLSSEIQMRPDTALVGIPAWNYREAGGTVIRLANGDSKCLINITNAWGATIDGIALDGDVPDGE